MSDFFIFQAGKIEGGGGKKLSRKKLVTGTEIILSMVPS